MGIGLPCCDQVTTEDPCQEPSWCGYDITNPTTRQFQVTLAGFASTGQCKAICAAANGWSSGNGVYTLTWLFALGSGKCDTECYGARYVSPTPGISDSGTPCPAEGDPSTWGTNVWLTINANSSCNCDPECYITVEWEQVGSQSRVVVTYQGKSPYNQCGSPSAHPGCKAPLGGYTLGTVSVTQTV